MNASEPYLHGNKPDVWKTIAPLPVSVPCTIFKPREVDTLDLESLKNGTLLSFAFYDFSTSSFAIF